MNEKFKPLEGDEDVLLFNDDTFTVGKVKKTLQEEFKEKFLEWFQAYSGGAYYGIKSELSNVRLGSIGFKCDELKWNCAEVSCKLLRIGSQAWQEGKLRMQASIVYSSVAPKHRNNNAVIDICLEFCPDEPSEPKSPLDDIRQSEEYKKLTNNN